MGGGKGGSDFDPKGKSEAEIMRFCQSFMTELWRYIGPNTDVPAGDIGVGGREIGYMYGQYKRLTGRFDGALTGKANSWGGSNMRPEATGYGCVYFSQECLKGLQKDSVEGKKCLISGSGNVAQFTCEKLLELGAIPLTFSDSAGTLYEPDGFTREKLDQVMALKERRGGRLSEYKSPSSEYFPGRRPWHIPADLAYPSATQNEIEKNDALDLAKNGCRVCFLLLLWLGLVLVLLVL